MLRLLFFLVQVAVLVGLSLWLMSFEGDIKIEAFNQQFFYPTGPFLITMLVALWLIIQVYNLVTGFFNLGARGRRKRQEKRNRKGIEAVTKGLAAIAAGDTAEAKKQQQQADKNLASSPLTHLIGAQTALLEGDSEKASDRFTMMLEDKDAAFMGLRGLISQAMKNGDREETVGLLRQAHKLRPRTFWVVDTLFRLEAADGNWSGSREILSQARTDRVYKPEVAKRYISAVDTQVAIIQYASGDSKSAMKSAKDAVNAQPDRAPAQLILADVVKTVQSPDKAAAILEKAWKVEPHPLYTQAYIKLKGAQAPDAILDAVKSLIGKKTDHPLAKLELGRAQLAAGDLAAARQTLTEAEQARPSHEVYRALGALAQEEGASFEEINEMQGKALLYPRRDSWVCSECWDERQDWSAVCPSCESFDTLTWGQEQQTNDTQSLQLEQRMASSVGLLENRS